MRLYHGTSFENYQKIKEKGFTDSKACIWTCSDPCYTYFWNHLLIQKGEKLPVKGAVDYAIREAFFSARITACMQRSKADRLMVLEVEIPGKYVELDNSCNTEYASQVDNKKLEKYGKITQVFTTLFDPAYTFLYLAGVYNSDFLDFYGNFTMMDREIIEELNKRGFEFTEELNEFHIWEYY